MKKREDLKTNHFQEGGHDGISLAMTKHTQEELESSMRGGSKFLSSWAFVSS